MKNWRIKLVRKTIIIKCCVDGATEQLLTIKIKTKHLFYPMLFVFRNSYTFWAIPRRHVNEYIEYVTGGMMTGQSTRRNPCPGANLSKHNFTWTELGSNPVLRQTTNQRTTL